MKNKIIGILACMLFIAPTFTVLGDINIVKEQIIVTRPLSGVEWEKTYGDAESDKFWDVEQCDDGSYIACGTTEYDNRIYPWAVKVDSSGIEQWRQWPELKFF